LHYQVISDMVVYMAGKKNNATLKKAEKALYESMERYRTLFGNSRDAIVITKPDGRFVDFNDAALDMLGYSRDELNKLNAIVIYTDPSDRQKFISKIEQGGYVRDYEVRLKKKNGTVMDCLYSFSVRRNQDGSVMEYQGIIRDITERKRLLEELQALSLVDELTGVYNRRGFFIMARQQMKTARRMNLGMFCIFIDLDSLKKINDTCGHQEGDRALADTARILKETFRESDIIGRIGGDEFTVLVLDDSEHHAEVIVGRLQKSVKLSNQRWGRHYDISLSVGVSRYEANSKETVDELVKRSDSLMYENKKNKRNSPIAS
jgi:diguanylate cyclase (GGDEF)-like protein/PAS domain S-box-containing protein